MNRISIIRIVSQKCKINNVKKNFIFKKSFVCRFIFLFVSICPLINYYNISLKNIILTPDNWSSEECIWSNDKRTQDATLKPIVKIISRAGK